MSVLKVHLTYSCTSQCDHCRFRCTRQSGPAIDYDLVMECVDGLKRLNHVETNASWATDDEAAHRFLEPLYAQAASVMFSLDAWHEPYVPPERVVRAARISETLGGQYILEIAYLDFPSCEHERDKRTNALLADLEHQVGKRPKVYQGTMLFNGRAAERLAQLVASGRGVPIEVCDQVPWWSNGQLRTLELLELDPEGYLSKGCGIAIANIHQTSVDAVLATYDATQHPIFSTLLKSGPLGLAQEAEALGYAFKADYADKCHLCQEARQVLLSKYPAYLVPGQHYRKND